MKLFHNFFIVLSILLFSSSVYSQSTHTIKGKLNAESEWVAFATVLVKSVSDSTIVKFGITDSLGTFEIKGVPEGSYFIQTNAFGYKDYVSSLLLVKTDDLDLGTLETTVNTEVLNEVSIVKMRPVIEIMPDKTVFNVENTINSTGANGFELLRKAPGVIIDNSNNIILEGKSGVQIFIDNKASILSGDDLVNFLMSLQASDIDAIEIITQPSSKFDAAGNAGIINILLKRDKRLGTNGSVGLGYVYGKNHRLNSSISLNHRNKKSNIYATYSNSLGKRWSFLDFNRLQQEIIYDSKTRTLRNGGANNAKIGADWFVGPNHTIGVLATGNLFNTSSVSKTTTLISPEGSNELLQTLIADNTTDGENYQVTGNINYRFTDTSGHEFSADADYGIYNRAANVFQPNLYLDGATGATQLENNYRMITPTNIEIITGKADYSQNFWKGKLSIGGKYSLVKTDNTFEFYDVKPNSEVLNSQRSNQFVYTENINAIYINFGKKIKPKLNLQLGLRGEQTISEGELISSQVNADDIVKRNYFNIFPSGGLTYTPNFNNIWSFTFSRRIQRPNYQSLNPFESQIDELSFAKGNPFLQPQYISNAKVSHTFKYRFNTSLSFSYVQDFFAQITDTLGDTKSFLISRNVADQTIVNLGVSLPFSVKKMVECISKCKCL